MKAGAVAGAVVVFAAQVAVPMALCLISSAPWLLPIIAIFGLPQTLLGSIAGAITGYFVKAARQLWMAVLIGVVTWSPIGMCLGVFFVSPMEPPGSSLSGFVAVAAAGAISGAVAFVFERSGRTDPKRRVHLSLSECLFLIAIIAISLAFKSREFRSREDADTSIRAVNGSITWDATGQPGIWRVELRGPGIGDKELSAVLLKLIVYDPLELDLTESTVTDQGLVQLSALPNLSQLKLRKTHVTPQGISELRKRRRDIVIVD